MYATKGRRADSARSQTRGVLLGVLHEREPELDRQLDGVARSPRRWADELGLDTEELDVLVRAAELHDIGKIAIPDEVLHKAGAARPTSEWELMRTHTLIGERVLERRTGAEEGRPAGALHATSTGTAAATPTASPARRSRSARGSSSSATPTTR